MCKMTADKKRAFNRWKRKQGKIKCTACNDGQVQCNCDIFGFCRKCEVGRGFITCKRCRGTGLATPNIEDYERQKQTELQLFKRWKN
jgi:hypothetical protein